MAVPVLIRLKISEIAAPETRGKSRQSHSLSHKGEGRGVRAGAIRPDFYFGEKSDDVNAARFALWSFGPSSETFQTTPGSVWSTVLSAVTSLGAGRTSVMDIGT